MSTEDEIARLRAQIAAFEAMGKAESVAAKAKDAYRKHPSEKTKAAHRAAIDALVEARRAARSDRPAKAGVAGIGGDAVVSNGEE